MLRSEKNKSRTAIYKWTAIFNGSRIDARSGLSDTRKRSCRLSKFRKNQCFGNIAVQQHNGMKIETSAALVRYVAQESKLAIDVFPCEDGHAQERSLIDKALLTVMHQDLWIADSCFVRKIFCLVFKNGVGFSLFVSINKYLW